MMSKLTQKLDEAQRLLTTYDEHKDSPDPMMRRKVAIDLDRFLMENRETAIILMIDGLQHEIDILASMRRDAERVREPWYKRWRGLRYSTVENKQEVTK